MVKLLMAGGWLVAPPEELLPELLPELLLELLLPELDPDELLLPLELLLELPLPPEPDPEELLPPELLVEWLPPPEPPPDEPPPQADSEMAISRAPTIRRPRAGYIFPLMATLSLLLKTCLQYPGVFWIQ